MDFSKAQLKKLGKRVAPTAAGLLAALSLALGGIIDSPDELFSGAPQAAYFVIATAEDDEQIVAASTSAEPAKKERLQDKLRRLFLAQPSVVRGVVLLPFWAFGKALLALFSLLFAALNPVLQILLGVLLNALLLFGLFLIVLKLLFPNLRLKDLLTKRNILLLAMGSLILSATDAILRAVWEDYRPISIAIKLCVGLLVLSLLCWRIFGKRVLPKIVQAT
ncbi:MAG TPA: hypothetical protein PKA81_04180 [Clostridia bacterium]|nr:hypothetical protein [Clostridia bacterium]